MAQIMYAYMNIWIKRGEKSTAKKLINTDFPIGLF
jgi:hypothetical protein